MNLKNLKTSLQQKVTNLLKPIKVLVCKFKSYHQKGYDYLVAKPRYQSLSLVLALLLISSLVLLPCIVWLLMCFASGELLVNVAHLNMWVTAWNIISTLMDHARLCGTAAACQNYHGLAYIWQFFYNLSYNSTAVWFHVLFALLLCFSAAYFVSMFMSLTLKKPKFKWAPFYTCVFGLLGYALILIILGLSSSGPDADSYMGAWLLAVFALFLMHVLTWLIQVYKLEYLALCALTVLVGFCCIGYALLLVWPDIVAFVRWSLESIALTFAKFT